MIRALGVLGGGATLAGAGSHALAAAGEWEAALFAGALSLVLGVATIGVGWVLLGAAGRARG